MERIVKFLKEANIYYLATLDGEKPRVRPFGTVNLYDGHIYIQTGKVKDVSKQIHKNPHIEISACNSKGDEWIRLSGILKEDTRVEAKKAMLDNYPSLRKMYDENDANTEVFFFESGECKFCSFVKDPEVVKF